MVEPIGESAHLSAVGGLWPGAVGPADGRGYVDGRDHRWIWFRQLRRGSETLADVEAGGIATPGQAGSQ
ncbi:hypothetical protein D3C80_1760180 [compost metagenome]